MFTKSKIAGSASAGMMSALIIFAGLLVYAKYYAFNPTTVQVASTDGQVQSETVALSVVEQAAVEADAPLSLANEAAAEAPTVIDAISVTGAVAPESSEQLANDASENVVEKPVVEVEVVEAPAIVEAPTKSLNIQHAVATTPTVTPANAYYGDQFAWRGVNDQSLAGDLAQAHYLQADQAGRYRQRGVGKARGDGEFNFSMNFKARSRMDADADADGDWTADHAGQGNAAYYQDQGYYPRVGYSGYRY